MPAPPSHADFAVGWICALPLEMAAARAVLDEIYDDLPVQPSDHNAYTLGRIAQHNVVIACLPSGQYGIASASTVAMHLLSSFQCVKIGLLVGIGGGIPSEQVDVRLGDVVVGVPSSSTTHGGVVQYDLGKAGQGDKFERTGMLNRPPQILLTAVSKLRAIHRMEGTQFLKTVREVGRRYPGLREALVGCHREDLLFDAHHYHDEKLPTCKSCDLTKLVDRSSRMSEEPVIHYGLIASGNRVVKDSHLRDRLGHELGACCVEMEAAGLVNNYPCLVIRGICDYADSHKNKEWQEYAATVAAAYAKQLLSVMPSANGLIRASANKSKSSKKSRILRSIRPSNSEIPCLDPTNPVKVAWNQMFENNDLATWYRGDDMDVHHGLIWIKGKPGSGKTSFLKHAFCRCTGEGQADGVSVAGFFSQSKDQDHRWNQPDLFRALVYQLLLTSNDDFLAFTRMFDAKINDAEKNVKWSEEELRAFLTATFSKPRRYRTIFFVDGLDECKGLGMRELALFFSELTTTAYQANAKLSVCLSSREFPRVSVGQCPEILIDRFNADEIQRYLHRKLTAAGFSGNEQWSRLAAAIIDKSEGVFLWVAIVLDNLLKSWDDGLRFWYLERELQDIPRELERLYERILSTIDGEDINITIRFFYWVILSTKRLRLLEWHHILAWIRDEPPSSLKEWRESDYFTETEWQLERQIQKISRGLVEVKSKRIQLDIADKNSTCGDAGSLDSEEGETRTVQVIHSSVAEFFLSGTGFRMLGASVSENSEHLLGSGHISILFSCLDYITIPELDVLVERRELANYSNQQHSSRSLKRAGSEASFGSSASNYAGSAHSGQYSKPEDALNFVPKRYGPYLPNVKKEREAPDEAEGWISNPSQPYFGDPLFPVASNAIERQYSKPPTPPILVSKRCGPSLPNTKNERGGSDAGDGSMSFTLQQYLKDPISPVAFSTIERATSDVESLLSDSNISQALQDSPDFLMYALNAFTTHAKFADQYGADPSRVLGRLLSGDLWARWLYLADTLPFDTTLLYFAVDHGLISWINFLLSSGVDPNRKGGEHCYPLIAAVINRDTAATNLLLKAGALPTKSDELDRSAFHHIANEGYIEALDCICRYVSGQALGQYSLNTLDVSGRTALLIAVHEGRFLVARMLLSLGADPNVTDRNMKSSLHLAAEREGAGIALCRCLLEKGASRILLSNQHLTPSQLALAKGYLDRVSLIEDDAFQSIEGQNGGSLQNLKVRLASVGSLAYPGQLYIRVSLGDDIKTLYPAQTWPDGSRGAREEARFSIPSEHRDLYGIHLGLDLRLYRILQPGHIHEYAIWQVKYINSENGETKTSLLKRRFGSDPVPISLEVTVPPSLIET
ncbi:hypothetical protein BJX63DRAFT_388241 [Aspergillus granulosus]|uniref:Nucleoside phosphorylase domain-containing protein n=1 Tax=Aspergillus granulosus TaxID=176169 RepID=A0ABR4HKT2_9EURO